VFGRLEYSRKKKKPDEENTKRAGVASTQMIKVKELLTDNAVANGIGQMRVEQFHTQNRHQFVDRAPPDREL
jgi:hypothetical protein